MRLVVVGASLAGLRACETARAEGFDGELVLVGAEPHLPYDRPPLTKALLLHREPEHPAYRTQRELDDLGVRLRLGTTATGLDLDAREVLLGDERLAFDELVVATGAAPRPLDAPGADLPGVQVVRTLDDARAVRAALDAGARTVVVGGGFVGAEVASAARHHGLPVTVVEAAPLPLVRALGEQVARLLVGLHARHGAELRLGTTVAAVEGDGRAERVLLVDGTALPADLVVVGTGASPCTGWLEGSGLRLDDGVLVDVTLRAAPHVHAAGDVARVVLPDGTSARHEHWTAASEQGAVAARGALGRPEPYEAVPFAWTEWYGVPVHTLGRCQGDAVHVAGDPDGDRWVALYRDGDRLAGAVTVGLPGRTPRLRRLLRAGGDWDAALALVA